MLTLIYPGSFNPIHTGHAILASWVSQCCPQVEELWLTVTPQNPLKPPTSTVSDSDRLQMTSLVAATLPRVRVSDFEFTLPLPSYTYATLSAMARHWPQRRFKLLIGSDNWLIFHKWRDYRRILSEFGIYIYLRPGYPVERASLPHGATLLEGTPLTDISSTFIRQSLSMGRDMNYFLPQPVYEYITRHHLYT